MDQAARPQGRPRSPTLAVVVGLACAAGALLLQDLHMSHQGPPPWPTIMAPTPEAHARLAQAMRDVCAPLDRTVPAAEIRGWIDDAFRGWTGGGVDVTPEPALAGFAGQYAIYRVRGTLPLDREEELVRRLLGIDGAPRWISGRRTAANGSVSWDASLAFRDGPPPRLPPSPPWRRPKNPGVECLSPVAPPAPLKGGAPAPAPSGARLDLSDPWTVRSGEVAAALAAVGRSPVESIQAEGPPGEAPSISLERTLVDPNRPWSCYAIIDGALVRPGEVVKGQPVRAVLADRILLGEGTPIEVRSKGGK